ncbi:transposable element Tcb1 transposase [Trichonephila clavipes]|nr:transposable element Tcb1 transposase [Trichonephila clavipes]
MQNLPDGHLENLVMTDDNVHAVTGIVLYLIQRRILIVWPSYSSLTFLRIPAEDIQECSPVIRCRSISWAKKARLKGLPPGVTLCLCRWISLTVNHRRLVCKWAYEHRAWQADWHQVVFSDESCFNLRNHDDRIRVRRYADERCFPECVIERHSGLTPGVMVWGAISYNG